MPPFDDDDLEEYPLGGTGRRNSGRGGGSGGGAEPNDEWDDPDERDLAPDEMAMVRCTNCRKWIIEETIRCPYCKEMQLEAFHHRKPFWFVIAVVLAILATLSWFFYAAPGWLHL